jgi:hypothetical protein
MGNWHTEYHAESQCNSGKNLKPSSFIILNIHIETSAIYCGSFSFNFGKWDGKYVRLRSRSS